MTWASFFREVSGKDREDTYSLRESTAKSFSPHKRAIIQYVK